MSVIEGVLREEIERLENRIVSYDEMLLNLPKGSIFIRTINGSKYAYRKRRDNGKVISEYLGNVNKPEVKDEINKASEFKRIKSNIALAKKELAKLRNAIKAYD